MKNKRIESGKRQLKRDPAVELARIFGCLIVIGVHTLLPYRTAEGYDTSRLFLAMLFADGVAVFWLIGGAFFIGSSGYSDTLRKTFQKVFIPMMFVGVFYILKNVFMNSVQTNDGFLYLIRNEINSFLFGLFRWRNGIAGYEQTWYVYIYVLLVLFSPAIKGGIEFLSQNKRNTIMGLTVLFSILLLNDYSHNEMANFEHVMFRGVVPAAFVTVFGYFIYQYRVIFQKWYISILALLSFIGFNVLRLYLQLLNARNGLGDDRSIMFWYTTIGLLSASSVFIFCLSVIRTKKYTRINRFICLVANYTFPVYLLHLLVIFLLNFCGFSVWLQNTIIGIRSSFLQETCYSFLIIFSVFVISFITIFVFRVIRFIIYKKIS